MLISLSAVRCRAIADLRRCRTTHPQIAVEAGGRIFVAWDEVVDTLGPGMYPAIASADKKIVAVWTTGGSNAALQFSAIDKRRATRPWGALTAPPYPAEPMEDTAIGGFGTE